MESIIFEKSLGVISKVVAVIHGQRDIIKGKCCLRVCDR